MRRTLIAAVALALLPAGALSGCVSLSAFTTHCYYDERLPEGSGQGGIRLDLIGLGQSSRYESPKRPATPEEMKDKFRVLQSRLKEFEHRLQHLQGKLGQTS